MQLKHKYFIKIVPGQYIRYRSNLDFFFFLFAFLKKSRVAGVLSLRKGGEEFGATIRKNELS